MDEPKFKHGDLVWLWCVSRLVLKVNQSFIAPGDIGYFYTLSTINDPLGAPAGWYQAKEDELCLVDEGSWDKEKI